MSKWRRSKAGKSLLIPALNPSEQKVFDELSSEGWQVIRNGWPDFLAMRGNELRFIEVKTNSNSLTVEQKRVRRALAKIGVTVEVIRVLTDKHYGVAP